MIKIDFSREDLIKFGSLGLTFMIAKSLIKFINKIY